MSGPWEVDGQPTWRVYVFCVAMISIPFGALVGLGVL